METIERLYSYECMPNEIQSKENSPKVSVIIPIYNVERFIKRCAESLMKQTLNDMEFIFVDDCSSDNSIDILKRIVEEYPNRNVSVLKQPVNRGVSAARELALSKATGKYIGFCDSDDWVDIDMYEKLVKLAELSSADIVGCGFILHTRNKIEECKFPSNHDNKGFIFSPHCFGGIYGALWNKLIRRDFFCLYDKKMWKGIAMWEDSCMLTPLRLHSSKTVFIDECLYHYNVNTNSMTTKFSIKKVNDAIEATKRLEYYFLTEGLTEEAASLVSFLKIASKEVLLRFPRKEYIRMWKKIFPEAKWHIMQYPNWGGGLKARALLVTFLPISLGIKLLKIKKK